LAANVQIKLLNVVFLLRKNVIAFLLKREGVWEETSARIGKTSQHLLVITF
jgi:hypothetical protein